MKKKFICIILSLIILTPLVTPISYCAVPYHQNINLQNIQGRDTLNKNLVEIQKIRNNISVIDLQSNTPEDKLKTIDKNLDFYISELYRVRSDLENYINLYKNSQPDVFMADASVYIIQSYILGLREAKFIVTSLLNNNQNSKNILYSQQVSIMYYYFTVGDTQLSCFEAFFINK